ncbi:P-loop containing nucleoside triphosphate hydrolase protein [Melanogaster broomeanus]|nr:P-loop containing nucleoside triphosphate hydrolase protein [Melanogaster broomeanus]
MPRRTRATTAEDHDSLEGNAQQSVKAKEEKVKQEKTGKGKARRVESDEEEEEQEQEPSQFDSHAGAADSEREEDAEGEEEGENDDEDGEGTPKGRKRARVNSMGGSAPASPSKGKERQRVETLPRDDDGFIPGSIVRIQLENFVTYDWVEFRPGPYLNMILGPNGTGKSSIACAICLGLNWPPSILGRASELSSFVKNDKEAGYIEIELKGAKGHKNLVIRRNLSAKSKSSTFTLNGQSSTGKEISNHMAKLNVQVGNLCSFLPQDKVSQFAQMTPQQLLRETQRAAGDISLTKWHDTLISSGKELKSVQERMKDDQEQLKTMVERNAQLEREVARYQERQRIAKEISVLEVLIPVNEYHEAKEHYVQAKERQRQLHARVTELRDRNAPAHAKLEQLAVQYKDFEKAREKKKNASKQKFQQMKAKWAESEKLENEAEEVTNKLDGLKRAEKDRVKKIKDLQTQIKDLQHHIANPPELEDLQVITDQLRQLNTEHNQIKIRMEELQDRQRANIDASAAEKVKISDSMNQLNRLDDERHRKLENLRSWDRDHADAVAWLRNNQNKFKMEVFEPPMISCSVPDKRFTNAVESCFNVNQLKTLVAQCEEDYELLNNCLNDSNEAGLRKDARINTWYRPKLEHTVARPPMTEEELKSLGFDAYAIDKLNCPDGLLWYLKREVNLHRTAIGLDGSKIDVSKAMEAVSRPGPRGEGGGATFIAGNVINTVQRSRYGRHAAQNTTRDVRPARNLVSSAVDPEIKRRLDQTIQEARQALELINEGANALAAEERGIRAQEAQFKMKFEALDARKKKVNDAQRELATLSARIVTSKNKLKELENEPSVDVERVRLKKKLLDLSKKRVKIAKDYTQLIRAAIADQAAATRSGLEFLQVGANKTALEALCQQKDERYQRALAEFEQADQIFVAAKADAKGKRDISVALVRAMDKEFQAQFSKMEMDGSVHARTVEQLRADLEVQQANLEMIMQTNPGVIEQYDRRQGEIDKLNQTLEGRQRTSQRLEREIKVARDSWQPALESLVESIGKKFSAAFDRIGCAGEIRINPHDDYDKWAIDILVKFRDKEKLQLLTGQRQSGGERSLTTILYLMSLTEEARTPFSLVDEINQGMDQRAERAVHNSMVEVTCKPDSGQYFLITPKLLADLNYHERMKVLCVNNGDWLPEERGLGNMMSLIDTFVRVRDRASRAM